MTVLLGMSGCASIPTASKQQDAAAKEFQAPDDKSGIDRYRSANFGGGIQTAFPIGAKSTGQAGPKTCFMWGMAPERHTIESLTGSTPKLTLDARPGCISCGRQ
ncbi:MAG: hypothetical protein P8009_04525 [Gammaproteobacteria bacterium]